MSLSAIIISALALLGAISAVLMSPDLEYLTIRGKQKEFYQQRTQFSFNAAKTAPQKLTTVLAVGESHRKNALDRFVFSTYSRTPLGGFATAP